MFPELGVTTINLSFLVFVLNSLGSKCKRHTTWCSSFYSRAIYIPKGPKILESGCRLIFMKFLDRSNRRSIAKGLWSWAKLYVLNTLKLISSDRLFSNWILNAQNTKKLTNKKKSLWKNLINFWLFHYKTLTF